MSDKRDLDDPTPLANTPDLTEQMRGARPAATAIREELVRARAERALFRAAEPAKVGRFVLLERVAGGGMGVVYSAYDPQLDRRVALKVLHPDHDAGSDARERLEAEARALARLDHPNVVPVHDVVVVDGQIVIVMELVEGQTLSAWAEGRRRSWREIVTVYIEAGRGLAAAHQLGLVHRDFKPGNAIVGDDGRVRVLDFGLARFHDEPAGDDTDGGDARGRPAALEPGLTATGAVLGTPGYMAPEQLEGREATARSDQFSFCAALHRAVEGSTPFEGDTIEATLDAIRAGRPRLATDGRRVPAWLRAAIARGLAAEPDDRHPSMSRLLDHLGRERGWRRWRLPAVAAVAVVAAATAALIALRDHDPLAACDGGIDDLEPIWNAERGDRLRRHFDDIGTPYARIVGPLVVDALDRYRTAWSTEHDDVCRDRIEHTQTDVVSLRRASCLDRRLDGLRAAVAGLETADAASVAQAQEVTTGLRPVADCADVDRLLGEAPPPETVADRVDAIAASKWLTDIETTERLGRSAAALASATALVAHADQRGQRAMLVEALLARGRILIARNAFDDAAKDLDRAQVLALEQGLIPQAVNAAARRFFALARRQQTAAQKAALSADIQHDLAFIEPLSRAPGAERFARPLLLNNLGVVEMSLGTREQARDWFEKARASLVDVAEPDPELAAIDLNLGMVTPDPHVREALVRGVLRRRTDELGPEHLLTLKAQTAVAHFVTDPAVARTLMEASYTSYRDFHPELIELRALDAYYLAFLESELGESDAALAHYDEVVAIARGAVSPGARRWRDLAAGHALLLRGRPEDARAHFDAAIGGDPGDDVWLRYYAAHGHFGIGLAYVAQGRPADAVPHLELAVAGFDGIARRNEDKEKHQRLATAQRALAEAQRARSAGRAPEP